MTYTITYKGPTGKELLKLGKEYEKMSVKGRKEVGQKLVDLLIDNVWKYSLIWKGNLVNSIKIKELSKDKDALEMNFYAWAIEKGHKIPPGEMLPYLKMWAIEKMGVEYGNAWIKKVFLYGKEIAASPFISDSTTSLEPKIKDIMLRNMRK